MPKWAVLLHDGRALNVYAATEEMARKQASHHETTRIVIATKRGMDIDIPPSFPFSVVKVKD